MHSTYAATHYNTLQHTGAPASSNASSTGAEEAADSCTAVTCVSKSRNSCVTVSHTCVTHLYTCYGTHMHDVVDIFPAVTCVYIHICRVNTLQHTATYCNNYNTLQHTASHTWCSVSQCVVVMWETSVPIYTSVVSNTATHCNVLQHTTTHCNTLHHKRDVRDLHTDIHIYRVTHVYPYVTAHMCIILQRVAPV